MKQVLYLYQNYLGSHSTMFYSQIVQIHFRIFIVNFLMKIIINNANEKPHFLNIIEYSSFYKSASYVASYWKSVALIPRFQSPQFCTKRTAPRNFKRAGLILWPLHLHSAANTLIRFLFKTFQRALDSLKGTSTIIIRWMRFLQQVEYFMTSSQSKREVWRYNTNSWKFCAYNGNIRM